MTVMKRVEARSVRAARCRRLSGDFENTAAFLQEKQDEALSGVLLGALCAAFGFSLLGLYLLSVLQGGWAWFGSMCALAGFVATVPYMRMLNEAISRQSDFRAAAALQGRLAGREDTQSTHS